MWYFLLPSNRYHLSCDIVWRKKEHYQNCSVPHCVVPQLYTVISRVADTIEQFLPGHTIGSRSVQGILCIFACLLTVYGQFVCLLVCFCIFGAFSHVCFQFSCHYQWQWLRGKTLLRSDARGRHIKLYSFTPSCQPRNISSSNLCPANYHIRPTLHCTDIVSAVC